MAPRRTEVTIDVNIGSIRYSGGRTRIPATVDGPGGGGDDRPGGGSGRGTSGSGSLSGLANIAGATGALRLRAMIASLSRLFPMLAQLGPLAIGVAAAVGGIALAAFGAVKSVQFLGSVFKVAGKVGLAAVKGVWEVLKGLGEGFYEVGRAVMEGTVGALESLGEATLQFVNVAGKAMLDFLKEAVAYFAEYEQNITNAVAITGATGEAFTNARTDLMDFAQTMATQSRYGAKEVASALYEIQSAIDLPLEGLKGVAEAAMQFAAATISDVTLAARTLTATLNAFGLAADQASMVADVFTQAINKSPLQMSSLSEALKYSMSYARMFGISLKEMTADLMAFSLVGMSGSQAGTTFRQVVNGLVRVSDKASAAFRAMGLDLKKFNPLAAGGLLPVIRQFEMLQQKFGKDKIATLIGQSFEVRTAGGLLALLSIGSQKLQEMQQSLNEQGVAAKTAAVQLLTLQGAWLQLSNLWQNVYVDVLRGGLSEGLKYLLYLLQALVAQATAAGVFKAFGAALYQLAGVVGGLVQALGPKVLSVLQAVVGALPGLVTRIGEAVTAITPALQDFGEWLGYFLPDAIKTLLPQLLSLAQTALPLLLNLVRTALPVMMAVLVSLGGTLQRLLSENGANVVKWFEAFLKAALDLANFLPTLLPILSQMVQAFIAWGPWLLQVALTLLPLFRKALEDLWPSLQVLVTNALPLLVQGLQFLASELSENAGGALQTFVLMLTYLMALIVDNWPTISKLMLIGLWMITQGMALLVENVKRVIPWVTWLLEWLGDNWTTVLSGAAYLVALVAKAIQGLAGYFAMLEGPLQAVIGIFETLVGIFGTVYILIVAIVDAVKTLITSLISLFSGGGLKGFVKEWDDWLQTVLNAGSGVGALLSAASAAHVAVNRGGNVLPTAGQKAEETALRAAQIQRDLRPGSGADWVPQVGIKVDQTVRFDPTSMNPDDWLKTRLSTMGKTTATRTRVGAAATP